MSRILLVEDNKLNRDMLQRRLARHGYQVAIAVDGAEALRMAAAQSPDLVLMDMSLPEIDGWDATRRLKGDERTRSIPVIALTAHAMPEDRQRTLAAGCDEYHAKPIDFRQLVLKMEGLLTAGGRTGKPLGRRDQ